VHLSDSCLEAIACAFLRSAMDTVNPSWCMDMDILIHFHTWIVPFRIEDLGMLSLHFDPDES